MKYTKKLSRSKGKVVRKSKSRRYGGKKEDNVMPALVTSTVGGYDTLISSVRNIQKGGQTSVQNTQTGGQTPAAALGYGTDVNAIYNAMYNFGNSILALSNLASNNLVATLNHSNSAVIDASNAVAMNLAGSNLVSNFVGNNTLTGTGLYQALLPNTALPAKPPASAPAAY